MDEKDLTALEGRGMTPLNLYLIERIEGADYGELSACVVAAVDEEDARCTERKDPFTAKEWTCTLIGIAAPDMRADYVIMDFASS